ncbi:MAG TPA: UDP-2,3-diacylglucosamine diphosphatase LpxI [Stellaceae bacterium]|nr:UDP-2,3-diacylglucosamine diphosphatase LpxI [Stellaceae bacterium]
MKKLGILAGGGELPLRIIDACRAANRPFFVLALEGVTDPAILVDAPHGWIRMGAGAEGLRLLREANVEDLVMAGAVRRPSLLSLRPDWWSAKILARIGYHALGDDGVLRAIVHVGEELGFRMVSVESVVPSVLAPEGVLGVHRPDGQAHADIARAGEVARALGAVDVGQAVVVQNGLVLGVEAIEGTDALLQRCRSLRREGAGGVLVKLAKPGQERRADLPTIGPRTVTEARDAGLGGIAIEAGASLILDRVGTVGRADEAGLFIIGITPP